MDKKKNLSTGAYLPTRVQAVSILAVLALSFGLLIPWLGTYWDDWPVILAARLQGVSSFIEYYRLERPFSAWTYMLTIPILGTRPLTWHIFSLLLRWLACLGMAWSLKIVWPGRDREITWMVLLFAVYPAFIDQPVAVAFSQHWITYALFTFSLAGMLLAARRGKPLGPLTVLAMLAALVHELTLEYFWGLEILRPLLLWFVFSEERSASKERLRKTLLYWSPYLVILGLVVAWRFINMERLEQANQSILLSALVVSPLPTLLQLAQTSLQDMIHNLVGAWYNTINPADLQLNDRPTLFSLVVSVLTGLLVFFTMRRSHAEPDTPPQDSQSNWQAQAMLLGLAGAFLGPLPVWVIERQSLTGLHSGRFALAAMFGLSILIVAILEWFTPRRLQKLLLVATLVATASGYQIRNAVSYYRSTLQQNDFYWQLYWRAPYIEPGTTLLSADELFPYVGRNPTAVSLNLVYPQPFGIHQVGYWFLELYQGVGPGAVPNLDRGKEFTPSFRTFDFSGSSLDSLVIFYKPGAGRCLWVLSPNDYDNPDLPVITLNALPVANLERIRREPVPGDYPPQDLFGAEPTHGWCYYYQKAQLAVQFEDWEAALGLVEQAEAQGLQPGNGYEWLPFIQAAAEVAQWDQALDLSYKALESKEDLVPRLCRTWGELQTRLDPPGEIDERIQEFSNRAECIPDYLD